MVVQTEVYNVKKGKHSITLQLKNLAFSTNFSMVFDDIVRSAIAL